MRMQNQLLEKEVHSLLIQLHSDKLEKLHLSDSEQKENIKYKLQKDLEQYSPIRASCKFSFNLVDQELFNFL